MKRLYCLTGLVLLALCLAACTNFTRDSYRAVFTATVTYEAVMQTAADAYAAGIITDDQKAEVIKYGTAAYGSIGIARTALEAYVLAGESSSDDTYSKVVTALGAMVANMGKLQQYTSDVLGLIVTKEGGE